MWNLKICHKTYCKVQSSWRMIVPQKIQFVFQQKFSTDRHHPQLIRYTILYFEHQRKEADYFPLQLLQFEAID